MEHATQVDMKELFIEKDTSSFECASTKAESELDCEDASYRKSELSQQQKQIRRVLNMSHLLKKQAK